MDLAAFVTVLTEKVGRYEPVMLSKIIGCILLKDFSGRERMRIAYGPESEIVSLINEAKSIMPVIPVATPWRGGTPANFWGDSGAGTSSGSAVVQPPAFHNSILFHSPYDFPMYTVDDNDNTYLHHDYGVNFNPSAFPVNSGSSRGNQSNVNNAAAKPCHYHYRGYCKHGTNCRFFHGEVGHPSRTVGERKPHWPSNGDLMSSSGCGGGSLDRLESEIVNLLRSRGGQPISIAMLPTVYYEMYGKALQAEGYLTESQRHGKSGCNLTKLLSKLKNSIRLIDRPHGQHAVMLAEDATRYGDCRNEGGGHEIGRLPSGQQVYLTFPVKSSFRGKDVANYFSRYGRVLSVRFPAQEERMYGFVAFDSPGAVVRALEKRNPHFVGGSRILVKPYKEKTRKIERRRSWRGEFSVNYSPPHVEMASGNIQTDSNGRIGVLPFTYDNSQNLEEELRRLSELMMAPWQPFGTCYSEPVENPEDRKGQKFTNVSPVFDASNNVEEPISRQDPTTRANGNGGSFDSSTINEIEIRGNPFSSLSVEGSFSTPR